MFRPPVAFAATLAALATAVPAGAADASKAPLRTIVYDVAYSTATLQREQTSGFTDSPTGAMGSVTAGSGAVDRRFTTEDRGLLTIAVVAATADGGLVVDSAFAGRNAHAPVRVAIFKTGGMSFDPRTPLGVEEARLLPFLARGFVAGRSIAPGEMWTVAAGPPVSGSTSYRVTHVAAERATLAIEGSTSMTGPAGFDEHDTGMAIYATDVLSPVSVDLRAHMRHQIRSDESDTTDAHLVATLVSDSFAKH